MAREKCLYVRRKYGGELDKYNKLTNPKDGGTISKVQENQN